MSTSDIKQIPPTQKRIKTYTLVGISLTLFCLLFTSIYEHFSHGAYSVHMRAMMLIPLIGCDFCGQILLNTGLWKYIGRWGFNLWNCGLSTIAAGLLFRGIVNISGRFTSADNLYYVLGCAFLLLSPIICIIEYKVNRSQNHGS